MPKFIKRHQKSIDNSVFKNKNVFGVPLKLNFQRHGQPLPQAIIHIMKYLRKNSVNTVGIFRKSGSKSRMNYLRELIEKQSSFTSSELEKIINSHILVATQNNTDDSNSIAANNEIVCIDLADILKQYFRELPECLFTNKLSQTLVDIFTCMKLFFLQD